MSTDRFRIHTLPDEVLRHKAARPIAEKPDAAFARAFISAMKTADGIGLASIQVGDLRPFVAVMTSKGPVFAIDPKITKISRILQDFEEGCLSVPGVYGMVSRPSEITVEYHDVDGVRHRERYSGLEATCWQHEIDHLDGILFIDKAHKITSGADTLSKIL